jgi:type IV pilus assembly protein PilN
MIRINLLPSEERKTRRKVSLPSVSGGAVLWTVVILGVYLGIVASISALQVRELNNLETKIQEAKEESARLAPQLAKIRKLTREREEVNKRLSIIASLDRDRYLRTQTMNDLAVSLPRNMWLTKAVEQGGTRITVEGVTFSNFIIADFMNNLERSDRFADVNLKVAEEGEIDGHKVVKFTLDSKLLN